MTDAGGPLLGMTVMPEFIQVEGVQRVLDNVAGRAGARVICTAPAVMEPADEATGAREPPVDAGAGGVRTLDRALWGKTALFVRTAPSFVPNRALYADSPYAPPPDQELTTREGHRVAAFLAACKRAGIETQFQLMAAAPPAYRVQWRQAHAEDEPLTAFGRAAPGRVDANLSLASPGLRAYMRALIVDLVDNYPDLDAFRFDWPEYPPYAPESLLFDFSPHAVAFGERAGFDVEAMRQRVVALCGEPASMRARLAVVAETFGSLGLTEDTLARLGVTELFDFRAALAADHARFLVETVREVARGRMKVHLQGFPPPLNRLSGFDMRRLDGLGAELGVKLFTMHWPMIERAYGERIAGLAGIDLAEAVEFARRAFAFTAAPVGDPATIRYPEPHEPHPADDDALIAKLTDARAQAKASPFWALAHGYGPVDDMIRRLAAAFAGSGGRVHMNRYGYLSDEKLTRMGALVRALETSLDDTAAKTAG